LGNANRYETQAECQKMCSVDESIGKMRGHR
jgi:hypothetical protein